MLKLNEVLKASKLGGGAPDYWTELFARRMAGWKIAELTGTLPITFRSNGTALINYRIFGTEEGAGEQTENYFDINNVLENYYLDKGIPTRFYSGGYVLSDYIPIASNTVTISAKITKESNFGAHLEVYDENKTFIRGGVALLAHGEGIIKKVVDASGAAFVRVDYALESFTDCMLNLGSTALPYVPYGYKLPLIVDSGSQSQAVSIYIGDNKLLRGDYVDYESGKIVRNGTPQDPPLPFPTIETFKGTNTLDSTVEVGEVTIKGKIKEEKL